MDGGDGFGGCWGWPGTAPDCLAVFAGRRPGAGAGGARRQRARHRRRARAIDPARRPCAGRSGSRRRPAGRRGGSSARSSRRRAACWRRCARCVVYGTALATGRLIHVDLVPELRARVFDKLLRLGFGFFRAQRQRLDHQPRHRRRAVAALVHRRRAAAGGAAAVHARRLRRLHGRAFTLGLTVACLAPTPLIWLATRWFSRWARPAYEKSRALSDAMVLAMSEGVKGIRVTKTFGAEAQRAGALPRPKPRGARPAGADLRARQPLRADGVVHHRASTWRSCCCYGGALVAARR